MTDFRTLQGRLGLSNIQMAARLKISPAHYCNVKMGREWDQGIPPSKGDLLAALWAEAGEVQPVEIPDEPKETDHHPVVEPEIQVEPEIEPEPETADATPAGTFIDFTLWPDRSATKIQRVSAKPWVELVGWIKSQSDRNEKTACPLIKLAVFGPMRTEKGSLRSDGNVVSVTGIEGDYDAGTVTPDEAIARMESAGLRALLYTSWSHTPETPRWRVLAPLAKPVAPARRLILAEALNGILGGVLAPESGVLSQSYFVGRKPNAEYRVLHTFDDPTDGFCLDEIDDFEARRVPFAAKTAGTCNAGAGDQADYLRDLLVGGDVHGNALRIVGRLVREGVPDATIRSTFAVLSEKVAESRGVERAACLLGSELDRMIAGARGKGFEKPKAPTPNADADQLPRFEIIEFRKGYRNGVHYVYEDAEGNIARDWICSPLRVTARTRAKASDAWGYLLEWADPDGIAHQWAMSAELLAGSGDEYRRALLDGGLEIAPGTAARTRLTSYIQGARTEARSRCVERTGWHDGAFVLPDRVIGGTGDESVIFQRAAGSTSHYAQCGTLDEWRSGVAALCVGNSRLAFAVSTAFASVLLDLTGDENGGVHYQGGSSIGKSTALYVACSVFGGRDYLHRWRATTNGLEAVAVGHSGALLCLDELGEVDPREAGECAYMLGDGSGKARALQSGGARRRQTWRLLFLSSGEIDLAQHMLSVGKRARAGQEIRLLTIPADAGTGYGLFDHPGDFATGKDLADHLNRRTLEVYGTAGIAFIEAVAQTIARKGRDALVDRLRAIQGRFVREHMPPGASEQVGRAIQRFGLIAVGGELAIRYGIVGWPPGEASRAAARCFQAWRSARGTDGNQEAQAILSQVRRFFEAHGEARFHDWDKPDERAIVNRAGVRRVEADAWTYYVLRETFKSEVCAGYAERQVIDVLDAAGMLTRDPSKGTPSSRVRLPGVGLTHAYKLVPFAEAET